MPRTTENYKSVSINKSVYDELVQIGVDIGKEVGISPLSVSEVIRYLKAQYMEDSEDEDQTT